MSLFSILLEYSPVVLFFCINSLCVFYVSEFLIIFPRHHSISKKCSLSLGLPDPQEKSSLPILKRVQAGISRLRLLKGPPSRVRLPITFGILRAIKSHIEASSYTDTAVVSFLRVFPAGGIGAASRGPVGQTMSSDVAVDSHTSPSIVQIHLKPSKCDQFGRGANIILGTTDSSICPVQVIYTGLHSPAWHLPRPP